MVVMGDRKKADFLAKQLCRGLGGLLHNNNILWGNLGRAILVTVATLELHSWKSLVGVPSRLSGVYPLATYKSFYYADTPGTGVTTSVRGAISSILFQLPVVKHYYACPGCYPVSGVLHMLF
ncbi:hypothetical protein WJX84_006427 [Apatococcus fuscideae]|uniref:Uncharacterized protein n=1 Tax=Apatococcus fuscideae TaxID=2026836 RepID=A0AAW1SVI8_9CHLO